MFNPEIHKKILFLDIDGVINNHYSLSEQIEFDSRNIVLLRDICDRTGAVVVLSTSWRNMYSRYEFNAMFMVTGFPGINIIGVTPELPNQCRGVEIKAWLDEHPGWENYLILDDDEDMLEEQLPFFHKTWAGSGLVARHVGIIVECLNTGNPIDDDTKCVTLGQVAMEDVAFLERDN